MSDTLGLLRSEKAQKVLRVLKDGNFDSIEPKVEFDSGVVYPAFGGVPLSVEEIKETLLLLSEAGILSSEIVDNVIMCPHCQSHKLMIRAHCPSCGSPRLIRGRMIEHLACGHIDFEEKFKGEEGLFCPSCGKPLKQVGSDYRTFSFLYRCLNCRSVFSNPRVEYICSGGHVFGESELTVHNVRAFKVNPDKRRLIERMAFDVDAVLKPLVDTGLSVKAPVTIQGRSGIKHDFSFAIWCDGEGLPSIVGSIHLSERALSATDVLALWAKASDVGVQHKLLITFSGADEDGRGLAAAYNLKIIEGKDAQDAAEKIKEYVDGLLKERKVSMAKKEVTPIKLSWDLFTIL
ncbi:MAG: hypothetical protein QXL45_03790 [Candidatus Bathyarchaeia archaeon]